MQNFLVGGDGRRVLEHEDQRLPSLRLPLCEEPQGHEGEQEDGENQMSSLHFRISPFGGWIGIAQGDEESFVPYETSNVKRFILMMDAAPHIRKNYSRHFDDQARLEERNSSAHDV